MQITIRLWAVAVTIALNCPLATLAIAQTAADSLCDKSPCPSTNDDYAHRLMTAWRLPITTPEQRAKIREYVSSYRTGDVIDWKSAATAYFSWRNGTPYVANTPTPLAVSISTPKYRALAEAAILDKLVDPDSAKFRWPYDFTYGEWRTPKKYEGYLTCGMVNARNRMGGFTGFQYFAVVIKDDAISYIDLDNGARPGINAYLCEKASSRFTPL